MPISTGLQQPIFPLKPPSFLHCVSFWTIPCIFLQSPPGTGIPLRSKLISARHVPLHSKSDLSKVPLSSRRVHMRIQDPMHPHRTLSACSKRFLQFWQGWCLRCPRLQALHLPVRDLTIEMAADACASSDRIGIGGFIRGHNSSRWFSERFRVADFARLNLPLQQDAQKNIGCWELLAQLALVILLSRSMPGGGLESASGPCLITPQPSPQSISS